MEERLKGNTTYIRESEGEKTFQIKIGGRGGEGPDSDVCATDQWPCASDPAHPTLPTEIKTPLPPSVM